MSEELNKELENGSDGRGKGGCTHGDHGGITRLSWRLPIRH